MKTDHAVRDVTCDNFVATQSYVLPNATGRKYYIRQNSTCSTPNVVNMTYCKKCKKQDFGSTNQDYVTIKVIPRRMFVIPRLQRILLMTVVMGNTFQLFSICH